MVSYFQNITVNVVAILYDLRFLRQFSVPGKKEAGFAVLNMDHNGSIIGFVRFSNRTDDGTYCASYRKGVAVAGDYQFLALFLHILNKTAERSAVVLFNRRIDGANHGCVQRTAQTAAMILMPMGGNHNVNVADFVVLQIGIDQTGIVCVSAIDQHCFSIAQE